MTHIMENFMKKKSYMHFNNILSEGLLDKLIRSIVPKKLIVKAKAKKLKKIQKDIEKIDKELTNLNKKSSDNVDRMAKALEKQYGVKVTKRKVADFYKERS